MAKTKKARATVVVGEEVEGSGFNLQAQDASSEVIAAAQQEMQPYLPTRSTASRHACPHGPAGAAYVEQTTQPLLPTPPPDMDFPNRRFVYRRPLDM